MPPIAFVAALRRAFETISSQIPEARVEALPTGATPASSRQISSEGIALIKRFEGCARRRADGMVEAYPDPGTGGAPWTIGWGATGQGIGPGTI